MKSALVLLAFAAAWFVAGGAYAQIQYQAGGSGGLYGNLQGATVSGKINVRLTGCPAGAWQYQLDGAVRNTEGACPIDFGGDDYLLDTVLLAEGAHVITVTGSSTLTAAFTVDNVPDAPTSWTKPAPLRCKPTQTWDARTTDNHLVTFGYCDDAQGYQPRYFGRDPSNLAVIQECASILGSSDRVLWTGLNGLPLSVLQAAWDSCITRPLTDTEKVTAVALATKWAPHFIVSGTTSQYVYVRNTDGTRGARYAVGGVEQRVKFGLPCRATTRLSGTTTRYHDVAGHTSEQGNLLPLGSYAQCTRQLPPSDGWP